MIINSSTCDSSPAMQNIIKQKIMIMNYHNELFSKMNYYSELSFGVFKKMIVHIDSSFCFFTKMIVQNDSSFQDELSHELSCDNELFVSGTKSRKHDAIFIFLQHFCCKSCQNKFSQTRKIEILSENNLIFNFLQI